jgi:hypothetical protein
VSHPTPAQHPQQFPTQFRLGLRVTLRQLLFQGGDLIGVRSPSGGQVKDQPADRRRGQQYVSEGQCTAVGRKQARHPGGNEKTDRSQSYSDRQKPGNGQKMKEGEIKKPADRSATGRRGFVIHVGHLFTLSARGVFQKQGRLNQAVGGLCIYSVEGRINKMANNKAIGDEANILDYAGFWFVFKAWQ